MRVVTVMAVLLLGGGAPPAAQHRLQFGIRGGWQLPPRAPPPPPRTPHRRRGAALGGGGVRGAKGGGSRRQPVGRPACRVSGAVVLPRPQPSRIPVSRSPQGEARLDPRGGWQGPRSPAAGRSHVRAAIERLAA